MAIAATSFLSSPLAADDRPNIMMLFADDLGRYASAYADPARPSINDCTATPTFDRIAREGVLATNMFASAPSCTPSRSALVSGRHFFRNGAASQLHNPWFGIESQNPWREVRGYGMLLAQAGYHVGITYKNHVQGDHFGPQFDAAGKSANRYSQVVSAAADRLAAREAIETECRQNFRDFLKGRKKGQPFLYSFHPTNPHRKWVAGSGKALWGIDPERLKGRMPPFLPDVPLVRQDMADYLGEGMAFDRYCEVLLEELTQMGELEKTLVVISGDHGAPGFPRGKTNCYDFGARVLFAARWPGKIKSGQVVDKPLSLIDVAPTFLAAAGVENHEDMNGQNLLPFLTSGDHDGLRGWALIGREVHVRNARATRLPYPTRALRTDDFLYVVNFHPDRSAEGDALKMSSATRFELEQETHIAVADIDAGPTKAYLVEHRAELEIKPFWDQAVGSRPAEELYDLQNDPHQMHNVASAPKYAEQKGVLRTQLFAELATNEDPRIDGDRFDGPPYCPQQ